MPIIDRFIRGIGETSPFLLSNHTPDAGGAWGASAVSHVISPNDYCRHNVDSSLSIATWSGDVGSVNYEVGVTGQFRSLVLFSTLSAVVRQGSNNGLLCRMYLENTSGGARVNIVDAFGGFIERAGLSITGIVAGRFYLIVGTASDSTFTTSVKDLSTNLWLTSSGTFTSASRVAAVTATVSAHSTAKGLAGIQSYALASDTAGAAYDVVEYGAVGSLGIPAPVTNYTLTGPSVCTVGAASSAFTVQLGAGFLSGTAVITPSDSGGGGSFTPASVSLTDTTRSATFTYTAATVGAKIIQTTNNASFTNPAALTVTASIDQTIYCDNVAIVRSPTNWSMLGTAGSQSAETVWPGSYMRLRFNGTAININVSTAGLSAYPWVLYQVDNLNPVVAKLTAGQTVISITGLSSDNHELNVIYQAKDNYSQANTWGDSQKLVITSFLVSGGTGILPAPTARPRKAIIYGDSIAAGLAVTAPPGVPTASGTDAATASYSHHIGIGLNAEFDQAGCAADGWTVGGAGGFPQLTSGWNLVKPGVTRNLAGHDYIIVLHGYNDGSVDIASSVITNWITAVRATTQAWIFLCVPFSGRQRNAITTGAANYISANPSESKVQVIDLGATFYQAVQSGYYTTDGIHPNSWQGGRLAAAYLGAINGRLGIGAAVATYRGGFRRS